jgi:hypothetical protein
LTEAIARQKGPKLSVFEAYKVQFGSIEDQTIRKSIQF